MTTVQQDEEFKDLVNDEIVISVPKNVLSTAVDWIEQNLSPDDVFTDKQLCEWAENNGYIKQ